MNIFKAIGNEFQDIGQNIKNAFAPNQKPVAEGKILSDGSVSHNIDLSEFEGASKLQAEELIGSTIKVIDELEQKVTDARASGDSDLADHHQVRLEEAKKAFTQVKWELEHSDIDVVTVGSALMGPLGIAASAMRAPDTADRIQEAQEVVGYFVEADVLLADESTGAAATTGAGKAGATSEGGVAGTTKSLDELIALFESDPEAFFSELREMDSEERGAVLMMVQNEIQQSNQLFSMLSNFQNAMHDTQKAMISNLRV